MNDNPNRTLFFWCVIVGTPLLVFATCEGVARLVTPLGDGFVALRGDPVFFERFERGGEPHVRIAHDELYGSGSVELPVEKPPGALRVFTLGGSASASWPIPRADRARHGAGEPARLGAQCVGRLVGGSGGPGLAPRVSGGLSLLQ